MSNAVNEHNGTGKSKSNHDNPVIEIKSGKLSMKKNLGIVGCVSLIVGTVIGSGIFISPKGVMRSTGSVGLGLIVWIAAGGISLLGGLCYAELGTVIPKSGGEYTYLKSAIGDIPAFLYAWTSVVVVKPSSLSVMSLTFSTYASSFVHLCGGPILPIKLIAAIALILVGMVNCWSTKLTSRIVVFFTGAKVLALIVIIIGGFYNLSQGKTSTLASGFEGTTKSPFILALAFYYSLWAYAGWNNLNYLTEEIKNSYTILPRAIVISVIMVIVIYVLANVSYLTVLTVDELLEAPAVAVAWGDQVLGAATIFIPLSVMVSTFGSATGSACTGGRVVFAAARDGFLPEFMSFLHIRNYTPLPSMIITICLALLMLIISGEIFTLIGYMGFINWFFYGLTFLSVVLLRFTKKDAPRPYKVPIFIPMFLVLVSAYLVVAPIIHEPRIEYLYAFLFLIGGLFLYFPFVYFNLKFGFMDKMTMYLQLFLEVAPSQYEEIK